MNTYVEMMDHLVIVLLMVLWLSLIVIEVARNYWMIEVTKTKPTYLQSFIIRGFVAIIHGVGFNPINLLDWLPILTFQCSIFFIIFSPLLNIFRGHKLMYIGSESGIIDHYTYQRPWLYHILYYVCCAAAAWSIYATYNRPLEW